MSESEKQQHHNSRTWAAGIGAAAILVLGSWSWNSVTNRLDIVQTKQAIGYERLAKLDAEVAALKEGLARIEKKLDQALEHK